ncbi:MAG: hypothetical protein BWY79_01082 [Actinobacteria bacterium ADurb.Bin444]|nr:MAG: hypothetical protein BWY79_01082 [Actinobacteria bacterium ADurb.Bin444]
MEHNDLIDTVEELGPEDALELSHDTSLHVIVLKAAFGHLLRKPQDLSLGDGGGADVGCHDDDGIAKIHGPALGIGETSILQDLEQDVEYIRMGLFDLIQQDNTIRFPPHGFSELASLFVPDITGRGAHQAADGVLLHVLGHVYLNEGVLVSEQELGQGTGQLGLPYTGGTEENEGARGATRIAQFGP